MCSITASSSTISYGDAVPAITPWYSGLPGGQLQTATPATCTTTATSTSPAGTYPTSCAGAVNGSSTITYVNGTITIEPAQVEVTASGGAMVVGGSVPTITAQLLGPGERRDRSRGAADLLDHGDVGERGRQLPVDLLGRVRPELHLLLRARHRLGGRGAGHGDRELQDRRRTASPRRSPPPTRASCTVRPGRPPRRAATPPRPRRARLARTPPRARVRQIRPTCSPT